MGMIIRLPFYLTAMLIWIFLGLIFSVINLLTLPATILLSGIFPSKFGGSVKDALTFGVLRRGFSNINNFLRYGF
jgi:uncharacterized membrane protein